MIRVAAIPLLLISFVLPVVFSGDAYASTWATVTAIPREMVTRPGTEVTYDVRVSAPEDARAANISLTVTLPEGFTYVARSTEVDGNPYRDPTGGVSAIRWSGLPSGSGNRVGIHALLQDHMDPANVARQLDWARALGGPGSYVKELFYPITPSTSGPQPSWVNFVSSVYDRGLIPVIRLQGVFSPKEAKWQKPPADPDGGYAGIAAAFRRVVAQLPRGKDRRLYLEIWNEPNLDFEWGGTPNPTEYGRFLLAVSQAIRSLGDPDIFILNGALSPGGNYRHLDYLDAMFRSVPQAAYAFDIWASHPYAGNHPPSYNDTYYSIRGYQWELARLAHYRDVTNLKVMATEAGYSLGNHDDPRYPPIDENNRAAYTREAFERYWSQDRSLITVAPFQLADPLGHWAAFDWVFPSTSSRADGTPQQSHAVYDAIRSLPKRPLDMVISFKLAVPKKEGSYLPRIRLSVGTNVVEVTAQPVTVTSISGTGVVYGRVSLEGRRSGTGVTISAGVYRTMTDADGTFSLALPDGSYSVSASAPGYSGQSLGSASIKTGVRTDLPDAALVADYPLILHPLQW